MRSLSENKNDMKPETAVQELLLERGRSISLTNAFEIISVQNIGGGCMTVCGCNQQIHKKLI